MIQFFYKRIITSFGKTIVEIYKKVYFKLNYVYEMFYMYIIICDDNIMSKLFVDESRFKTLTLVASQLSVMDSMGAPKVHRQLKCSLTDILSLHTSDTLKMYDYLTNSIHLDGVPLVFTCKNDVSGLFGKQTTLTYVPSSSMVRMIAGAGVALGTVSAVATMIQALATQKQTITSTAKHKSPKYKLSHKQSKSSWIVSAFQSLVGLGAFASLVVYPFRAMLRKFNGRVPFSNYPDVSKKNGMWMVAQQYDPFEEKVVMIFVVPLPSMTHTTSSDVSPDVSCDWCVVRITSGKIHLTQKWLSFTFVPQHVDTRVIQSTRSNVVKHVKQWTRLLDHWETLWTLSSDLKMMSVREYNQAHENEKYASVWSVQSNNLILPIHSLYEDESRVVNRRPYTYCQTHSVNKLPRVFMDNVVHFWTPLSQLSGTSYIHKSQLHTRSIHHVFAFPLDPIKMHTIQQHETLFIEQVKEVVSHTAHQRISDQLQNTTNESTKYILLYVSSNRINNIDGTVQLFQPYACEVYTCVVPNTVSIHALQNELANTQLGGERFAFKHNSSFVSNHRFKLYSAYNVNKILSSLYAKNKDAITSVLDKYKSTKDYHDALDMVVDHQYEDRIQDANNVLKRGQWDPKKRIRTKKELRQIKLYYMNKQKKNKVKKRSISELEKQMARLTLKDTSGQHRVRYHSKTKSSPEKYRL